MLLVSADKYTSKKVVVSSSVNESVENELKENNNGFGYLFDVKICWIFFQKHAHKQAATPPC